MTVQIQLRRDTTANWASEDPTLAEGELGIDLDTGRFKIGDGSTAWTSLAYAETTTQLQGVMFVSDTASQADSDPGAGFFRWNHATQSSATELYLSNDTVDAVDVSALFGAMGANGLLYVQQLDDSTNWQLWQIASADVGSDYSALTVTLLGYGGAIGSAKAVMCDFSPGSAAAGSDNIGYLNIPQNSQSGDYTTVLADAGKHLLHPSADTTPRTFTIDSNANVPYPLGTAITFVNHDGAGDLTIAITSDTLRLAGAGTTGSRTLAENGIATALKLTSTEWIISGTGLS